MRNDYLRQLELEDEAIMAELQAEFGPPDSRLLIPESALAFDHNDYAKINEALSALKQPPASMSEVSAALPWTKTGVAGVAKRIKNARKAGA